MRAYGRRPVWAGVRLLATMAVMAALLGASLRPSGTALATACFGDEQILLAPPQPRAGEPLIVAAVSRFPHGRVVLEGPGGPQEPPPGSLGDRFVWQLTVIPEAVGSQTFSFGVVADDGGVVSCTQTLATVVDDDMPTGTIPAGDAEATAGPESSVLFASLHPWQAGAVGVPPSADAAASSAATPAPVATTEAADPARPPHDARPTSTRRPTNTPVRRVESDNGNENDNESEPTPTPTRTPTPVKTATPTRTPRPDPTDTPAPTPTATLPPAEISLPASATCGQTMTIRGAGLGATQKAVSGSVRIDGRQASVTSWSMEQIEAQVPLTVRAGNDREVEVDVAGKTVGGRIRLSC